MKWRRKICFSWVVIECVLAIVVCRADEKTNPEPRRTWKEVKEEIDQAFDACRASVKGVREKQPPGVWSIGGRSGGSIHPGTSESEIVFTREPSGEPAESVVILDIRVERDYIAETGKASSFRIIRYVARDQGKEMLNEMVSFFEKKKWPLVIFDKKKSDKKDSPEKKELTPVF